MKYMGAIITQEGQTGLPPKHLTGCSIYPPDAFTTFNAMTPVTNGSQAWDIAGGEKIVNASQNTPLIHHFWGEPGKWPLFVHQRRVSSPENEVMLDFIKPEAVLFHRAKGGDLIPLLRNRKSAENTVFSPRELQGKVEIVSLPIVEEPPLQFQQIGQNDIGSPIGEVEPKRRGRPPMAKPAAPTSLANSVQMVEGVTK
jgi:hypothetical protein